MGRGLEKNYTFRELCFLRLDHIHEISDLQCIRQIVLSIGPKNTRQNKSIGQTCRLEKTIRFVNHVF